MTAQNMCLFRCFHLSIFKYNTNMQHQYYLLTVSIDQDSVPLTHVIPPARKSINVVAERKSINMLCQFLPNQNSYNNILICILQRKTPKRHVKGKDTLKVTIVSVPVKLKHR
jgi:hypothetical protein